MPKTTKSFSPTRLAASLLAILWCAHSYAAVLIEAKVTLDESGHPARMVGTLSPPSSAATCYYLPYNDPEYNEHSSLERRLEIQQSAFQQISKAQGFIEINGTRPMVYHARPNEVLRFAASPPRLSDASRDLWVWEGFHPRALTHCPDPVDSSLEFQLAPARELSIHITVPEDWTYAGIGQPDKSFTLFGTQFGFALTRGWRHARLAVDDVALEVFYRSPQFIKLLPTLRRSLVALSEWYGPLPYPKLVLIESDHLESSGVPGLVLMNRPRQDALRSIQIDWLNWSHWMLVNVMSRQWLGAYASLHSLHDEWLFRGTIEYVTMRVLEDATARANIYNTIETGVELFEFNYRELQDIGAAVLYQDEPNLILTDRHNRSALPLDKQHSQTSLRHALAIRYAVSQLGTTASQALLHDVIALMPGEALSPAVFINRLKAHSQVGAMFAQNLQLFWQNPGWPDFDIDRFESESTTEGWRTSIDVVQEGELPLNATVTFVDEHGYSSTHPLRQVNGHLIAAVNLKHRPTSAEVDAERHVYDSDRYNNTTRWPGLAFFPGNARGLPDDELTVLWAPYPFRRPGQPWSLALNAGLFRYINSSTTLALETEFGGEHRSAFSLAESYQAPRYSLNGSLLVEQNIFGSRVFAKQFGFGPLFRKGPRVDLLSTFRHRQVVGRPKSGHQTIGGTVTMRNRGQLRHFGYNLMGEYEAAPKAWSPEFQYERRIGVAEGLMSIPGWLDYKLRLFRGEYTFTGDVPEELFFNPEDLEQARLRLDVSGLDRSAKIYSIGNDLFLPFSLRQGSGTIMLNRRLRWRLFYDYGRALDLNEEYRAAGGGILIPIGGDVTGIGTLSLTRFTLLVVGYSYAEGVVSTKPRVLFTFGAEL